MIQSTRTLQGQISQRKRGHTNQEAVLPERILNDIRDSFGYFDSENSGTISMSQLKAILQYVGGGKMPRKDLEKIIQEFIGNPLRVELKDVERIATKIWYEGGQEHERRELFRMFDKKDRGSTTMEEIKNVLQSKVVVPVTDEDVEELMGLLGVDMTSPISLWDFAKYFIFRLETLLL